MSSFFGLRKRLGLDGNLASSADGREGNQTSSSFQYTPFKQQNRKSHEFRLLRLLPVQSSDADIKCELFHTKLYEHPPYHALSYVWGDSAITKPISVNGFERHVTANLHLALRYLRYGDKERILWVDALCINQDDAVEKSFQVQLMRTLYVGAAAVQVWLGEENGARMALDFCESLPSTTAPDREGQDTPPPSTEAYAACMNLFYGRPYWTRTWVVQEVFHSRVVWFHVGNIRVAKEELYELATRFGRFNPFNTLRPNATTALFMAPETNPIISSLASPKQDWAIGSRVHPDFALLEVVDRFRSQQATDPRDKIYALVGMAGSGSGINVDYRLSKKEVYKAATIVFLKISGFPLLLAESRNRRVAPDQELPSWVPDYSDQQRSYNRFMALHYNSFSAGVSDEDYEAAARAQKMYKPPFEFKGDLIRLKGIAVAKVTQIFREEHGPDVNDNEHEMTLFDFDLIDGADKRKTQNVRSTNQQGRHDVKWHSTSWGPFETQVDDLVAVIAGCRLPLVFRRHGVGYLLVGACWLVKSQIMTSLSSKSVGSSLKHDEAFSDIMRGSVWKNRVGMQRMEEFVVY